MSPSRDAAVVEAALARARAGEVVEIFLEDSTSRSVTVVDGEPESSEDQHERGAGIRVFREQRVGFSYTADLGTGGIERAVDDARELSARTRPEEANQAPSAGDKPAPEPEPAAAPSTFAARLDVARRCEAAARAVAPGISTRASSTTEAWGTVRIAHSGGLSRTWSWNRCWSFIEVGSERGDARQMGYESDWSRLLDGLDPAAIGAAAAGHALRKFGAVRPATGKTTLVLDPRVTVGLFDTLAAALSGKAVVRERSLFAGRVGDAVAAPAVTLVDDGAQPEAFACAPFDGEGLTSGRAELIRAGVLAGFLHDTYTSLRLKAPPTGHAVRDAFGTLPGVGTRNLHLRPTGPDRAALLRTAGDGIYVDEVMGLHTIDPVSGDFSIGASGRRLAGGEPGEALEGFAISGNVLPLLRSVEAVADDLRFFAGGTGGSTVLLREVMVSGT